MSQPSTRDAKREPGEAGQLDAPTAFFHLFAVVARHRDAKLDRALKPLGLNVSRHRALSVVALMEPCSMKALADFSAVDRTTMTRTVDQLVRSDLVLRTTSDKDRRQVILNLTDHGRRTYRQALKIILGQNRDALSGMPENLQRQGARALEAVLANIVADADLLERLLAWPRTGRAPP